MATAYVFNKPFSKASFWMASVTGGMLLSSMMLMPLSVEAAVPAANPASPAASSEPEAEPPVLPAPEEALIQEALTEEELINNELTERELSETANYSDGEISIDYPVSWQVSVNELGEVSIFDTADDVPDDGSTLPVPPTEPQEILVETQVFRVAAPPGPLVDANIDSFIDEGAAVSRYTSVEIDEQDALVIWLADRPNELSSAIATFIGYGDETIFLFSRYSPDDESAENSILRLHSSFTNLRPNLAEPDRSSLPPSDTAAPSAQPPR